MADNSSTGYTPQDRGLVSHIGPVKVDWPRSLGYYGGIGIALAAGVIDPPLASFIAAIPFLKMLNRPKAPLPVRFVGQVLDGAAKPVGGSSEATIELDTAREKSQPTRRPSMWQEARKIANGARASSS